MTISAKHSILDISQGSDYASGLLKLLCCGSKRDTPENSYIQQTKNFPLFWGHTWKYNIQVKEKAITEFDIFVLCFIFFIPLPQTICAINTNDTCYFLHASNEWCMCGVCTCNRTHQMKKTAIVSQRGINVSTCLMRNFRSIMLKWKPSLSIHLPACLPLF